MTSEVAKVQVIGSDAIGRSFITFRVLVICVYISHRFLQDITTFVVYVTACDIETSFSFDTSVEIIGHVRFLIHV